jgi:hypothetical protein
MSQQDPQGRAPTEEELRAAYEAELKRIRVDDVIVQTIVSLLNLGGRRAGLAPGTEGERDLAQVRQAIEGARALLPLLESRHAEQLGPVRDTLARLQMVYAQRAGQAPAQPEEGAPAEPATRAGEQEREGPGPAQSSGRLWIPGQ